jgi:hypothetical protein
MDALDHQHSISSTQTPAAGASTPGRGRPPTRPWEQFEVTTMILQINSLRQAALALAQCVAVSEAALAVRRKEVPPELWDQVHAVIGRQRRYAPGLTPREHRRLGELALEQETRPGQEWAETKEDRKLAKELAKLREKLHGRRTASEIDLSLTRGSAGSSLARKLVPRRLKGLWLAFDTWGSAQFGISVKTFRDWRRWAVAADKRLPEGAQLLRSLWRREAPTAERHPAR